MRKKPLLAVAVCTAALAGASASAAFASEVIGPPGSLTPNEAATSHANSICVFSGLNDNPTSTDPENPGGIVQSVRVQCRQQRAKGVRAESRRSM